VSIAETLVLRAHTVGAWVLPITLDLQALLASVYLTVRSASICMHVADTDTYNGTFPDHNNDQLFAMLWHIRRKDQGNLTK
jgi:hypothetical protein